MSLFEALDVYGSKAPVCVCRPCRCMDTDDYSHCGPQRKAMQARRVIEDVMVIPYKVDVALAHVRTEGREEFDAAWKAWRQEVRHE